ncbi:hypothetical protein ID866_2786 [Astraeus odoratus]|nr:hypothetical protein ID866_2786 [Astraeus odoratus]
MCITWRTLRVQGGMNEVTPPEIPGSELSKLLSGAAMSISCSFQTV